MRYFRNVDIVNEFGVNEATVRKWIRDAKAGRLNLTLYERNGRVHIADIAENTALIKKLIETRRKYRNSKAASAHTLDGFSGIWFTDYVYHNSQKDEDEVSQQYVRIYQKRNSLIVESVPGYTSAYIHARFSVDGNIATGTWQQATDPSGDYKGAIYHGAAQLVLSADGKSMEGKWLGFGKNMEIKTGPWKFTYIGDEQSAIDSDKELVTQ